MSSSAVVQTICRQLRIAGINPGLHFVAWDENTLKVSRGPNGSLIHYNHGTDLYDIEEYHGLTITPLADHVYAENLLAVIMSTFSDREVSK